MRPTDEPPRHARTDDFFAVFLRTTIRLIVVGASLLFSGCVTGSRKPPETTTPPWNPDPSQSQSKWEGKIPGAKS